MSKLLYILYNSQIDKYYIGSTTDIFRRLLEHNSDRKDRWSSKQTGVWALKYYEKFATIKEARTREKIIKRKKSRKYLIYLIEQSRKLSG